MIHAASRTRAGLVLAALLLLAACSGKKDIDKLPSSLISRAR